MTLSLTCYSERVTVYNELIEGLLNLRLACGSCRAMSARGSRLGPCRRVMSARDFPRQVAVCDTSLMCAALVQCRRHPSADRPLIDWDLILVMEPMTIVGAVLGGFVTKVLPGWSTNVLLFILLVFLSERLWKRALQTVQNETALSNATSRASLAASTGRDLEHQSVRCYPELLCICSLLSACTIAVPLQ